MLGIVAGIIPSPAAAQTSNVAVVFSICTGLPSSDVVDFTADLNRHTTVSDVSPVLLCGAISPLLSSDQMLSMRLENDGNALFLTIQPVAKSTEGGPVTATHRRLIDWSDTESEFIEKTRAAGKVKTLALLIDNMVLDYADIHLSPDGPPITDAFAVSGDEGAMTSPTPMVRQPDNGNSADNLRVTEDATLSRSVSCVCDNKCDECEKKLEHLRLTLDGTDTPKSELAVAKKTESDNRHVRVGVGGGVNLFTAGNVAPQMMVDVSLVHRRIGLVLRFTGEGDSSFEINDDDAVRGFDTRVGALELGPGWFGNRSRLGVSLQPLLVLRYWEVKRADLPNSTTQLFVDMGAGLHVVMAASLGKHLGIFFRAGVQIFPAARRIMVENGPQKRIGLLHFPLNPGFFVRF